MISIIIISDFLAYYFEEHNSIGGYGMRKIIQNEYLFHIFVGTFNHNNFAKSLVMYAQNTNAPNILGTKVHTLKWHTLEGGNCRVLI